MQSIVITGASSGIGKATAKHFAAQGWKVAATMRTPAKETELTEIDHVSIYPLDVTDLNSVNTAASRIIAHHPARGHTGYVAARICTMSPSFTT